jgi:hypothetical protein
MNIMCACGTWIKGYHENVVRHIESCEIFPNIQMIVEATGIPEHLVRHTVGMLLQQEGFCVGRTFLFAEDMDTKGFTRTERLIFTYVRRGSYNGPLTEPDDIRDFMNQHRYYDSKGSIRYRFSEEEVRHAMQLFDQFSKPSQVLSPDEH